MESNDSEDEVINGKIKDHILEDRKEAPETYSIYFNEDEDDLVRWIEFRLASDDYYNQAHLFKKALNLLRKKERDEVQ